MIWKVGMPLTMEPKHQLFEYACHEGNYGLENILAGARAAEGTLTTASARR